MAGLLPRYTSDMIRFACPNCEKVYTVPESAGGKAATCKECGTRFQIPDAAPSYEVVEEAEPVAPVAEPPSPPPPPPPVPPPPPPPVPAAIQHAETMMLPAMPDPPTANPNAVSGQSPET